MAIVENAHSLLIEHYYLLIKQSCAWDKTEQLFLLNYD